MICVEVNGIKQNFPINTSVSALVFELKIDGKNIALIKNDTVLPKSEWNSTCCENGDNFVVFTLVAGG